MLNVAFNPHFRGIKSGVSVGLNCQIDSHSGTWASWKWGNSSVKTKSLEGPSSSPKQRAWVAMMPSGLSQGKSLGEGTGKEVVDLLEATTMMLAFLILT